MLVKSSFLSVSVNSGDLDLTMANYLAFSHGIHVTVTNPRAKP